MKIQNAGKVIDSGGFGCIFVPNLKCENDDDIVDDNKLSKLMTNSHAEDEYELISSLNDMLNTIPNYSDYFLINDVKICKPNKLTKKDLSNYNNECKPLIKKGITLKNINSSLDKIKMITMPYGGVNVDKFLNKYWKNSNIIFLNNSLINLLNNGILPMNKLGIYHCDIKDSNVLVELNGSEIYTRLIDWGLSVIVSNEDDIPRNLYRRPFQYNVPFSSILFSDELTTMYNDFLKQHNNPTYYEIREFVINYIFIWNEVRGSGHLNTINNILKRFVENDLEGIESDNVKNHIMEYDFTYYYIINYLADILYEYTENDILNLNDYFYNIFLKNIDVWGFLSIYLAFVDKIYNSHAESEDYTYDLLYKLKDLVINYLYSKPLEIINVKSLSNELTNLNKIIKNIEFKGGTKRGGSKKRVLKKRKKKTIRKY
jgi:hypothetical protein